MRKQAVLEDAKTVSRVNAPAPAKVIPIHGLIREKKAYEAVKRLFDLSMSFLALIAFSPIILIIALAIKLEDRGPVFYKHKRVGKNGADLYIYKFRSMAADPAPLEEIFTPEQMEQYQREFKVDDDPRITKVGRFLRRTSLDELPQLVNILKGELSIVGPRPVLQEETEKYGIYRTKFLSVIPGLTGYWQANGRSDTTYEQRMDMELYYVDHRSLWFDIKIIFQTVGAVLKGKGAK